MIWVSLAINSFIHALEPLSMFENPSRTLFEQQILHLLPQSSANLPAPMIVHLNIPWINHHFDEIIDYLHLPDIHTILWRVFQYQYHADAELRDLLLINQIITFRLLFRIHQLCQVESKQW